jgi:Inositol polyphosphate kinase
VYRPHLEKFVKMTKDSGKTLTEEQLPVVLAVFLSDGEARLHRLAAYFCERIKALREIMASQKAYNLISTSLLLVYDADMPGETSDHEMLASCKTIDFANATLQKDDGHEVCLCVLVSVCPVYMCMCACVYVYVRLCVCFAFAPSLSFNILRILLSFFHASLSLPFCLSATRSTLAT